MPRRDDIHKILLIGSGPIVIGQACEFDYSGVQACKALREEGYEVVLVNSNPATIMTDPDTADTLFVDPDVPDPGGAYFYVMSLVDALGVETGLGWTSAGQPRTVASPCP